MTIPLELIFHNMDASPYVEADVREKAEKLTRYFDRIIGCRVVVEAPPHHQHKGRLYDVRIDISVPGNDIVVNHQGPKDHAHEDVYVAVRDAFDAAYRQLEDHARKARGDIKEHETPLHGTVRRMFPDHGFVETSDGREIYFHRNSVVEGEFDGLKPGSEVRLEIVHGESAEGPQATTVKPIGKHHLVE
ncbi:HPF/RaiA family ribosome-associated protein [Ferruginivarius sediminum]|uniref:HPF/RaiA family ribosome-associated protein n=1 Tax=Ferruginivarius sediminum TaxID=2661937 RepID=A0A369T6U1_9PROT|nr:HPF/RaiA family ribosome-associated protein [Ferruginivarius sediminum]RDD61043.1 HPF/RaiA family ribosome-associated protein [Ferruginivarius sediminum]